MSTTQPGIQISTVVAITVGTFVTGAVAYAVYFDHKRRTDPGFRKALRKEAKQQARAAKEEAEAEGKRQKQAVKNLVERANQEGFPEDNEEKEEYFMNEVARGERMIQDGANQMEAALCFYKALKVYPQPKDLINIYDKTVPKPVIDILAEMIAVDPKINIGPRSDAGSSAGGIDD